MLQIDAFACNRNEQEALQIETIVSKRNTVRKWCEICNTFYLIEEGDDRISRSRKQGAYLNNNLRFMYDTWGLHCVKCHSGEHNVCLVCGSCLQDFGDYKQGAQRGHRSDNKYCSNACRQKAYRARKKQV